MIILYKGMWDFHQEERSKITFD